MFQSIWQIVRGVYTRRRSGMDRGNIEHLRADLRFRLAMVEYAYFGRSGRRVARCLTELKAVLGEKAVHRYLRTLDPDLRTQFVERFQGARRSAEENPAPGAEAAAVRPDHGPGKRPPLHNPPPGSNVVPIHAAARRTGEPEAAPSAGGESRAGPDPRSVDYSD